MLRNCSFSRLSPISSLHRSIDSIFSFLSFGSNTNAVPSGSTVTIHWLLSSHFSNSSRDKVDYEEEGLIINRDPKTPPKLFVIQPRLRPDSVLNAKLAEALNLANSLEEQRNFIFDSESEEKELPDHIVVQNPVARSLKGHSDTYFGQGTVDTIKCHLNALESKEAVDAIFVNSILSGIQQRNLEREWGKPVLDRVGLIIEIFNAHAQTKEAKLQSELAALMYKRTRLVRVRGSDGRYAFGVGGEAEVVSARGRGSGGRGFISGAGETELQLQRRRILERRSYLLSQIEEVRRTRALQRASRRRHGGPNGQGLDTVAVVGYTNAGKSTLVSALSNTDLYRDDRLFATVDPRLRSVFLPSGRKILLSDTVGFISDLPVQLVEAFHATLEEVVEADLLVHVLDASAPNMEEQRSAVLEVLHQIGVPEEKFRTMIEVRNKIDLCEKNSETKAQELVRNNEGSSISEEEAMGSELLPKEQNGINSEAFSEELVRDDGVISTEALSNVDEFNGENVHPNCDLQCIETSAITGSGLQELLKLIDDKLNTARLVERISFDRKWRPPHTTHADTAVE